MLFFIKNTFTRNSLSENDTPSHQRMKDSASGEIHFDFPLPMDASMQHQSREQDEEAECRVCRGEAVRNFLQV